MLLRSIRFRLTLWYALALAVLLTASGVFWFWYLGQESGKHLDERMSIVAANAVSLIEIQLADTDRQSLADAQLCERIDELTHRQRWDELVQIWDVQGKLVCSTESAEIWHLSPQRDDLLLALHGDTVYRDVILDGQPIRVLLYPASKHTRFVGAVLVASRQGEMHAALANLRLLLLTFSPITLLLMSIGGWFLAGRTISPVTRISRSMQRINAESLDQRLPVSPAGDEISELAETFNGLLARLHDSFRKIRQFSGDASHELRTPLTILKGETEVALRWAKTPEEYRNALHSNLEEINRMERIIEDLLQLAKSDAGELQIEIEDLSLSDLILEIYMQGRSLAEGRQLEIEFKVEVDREIRIMGDALRLRQLFLNLIVNAIKYTPDPGRVDVCLATEGDNAVVRVIDNGIGIPEPQQAYIFDRFYRVDQARNREVGGAGLGLSIVKWIVAAHAGQIEVSSEAGQGSIFTVTLPMAGPQREQGKDVTGGKS
ncbi:MAG TPA: heavy metal sensor histidine kinase [Geothermobacteraceae bacterium]|nr:heavy metal sensor histidine kinase [Geothermobacteraceae bacterium]